MEPRLTAGLRVAALLRRADLAGRGAYVIHRGDDTAGAICLTVVRPGGRAELWGQEYDPMTDSRPWVMQLEGTAQEIEAAARRRRATDPDLWVIELELPEGQAPTALAD
ncbi:DUF1491 family protein [Paracoccus sp. (in: a-proteobacteria)]|uniref:DUF1491 family protein n=1 Tax=Paracoccus sp. TaxID=267 RepID=UPI0026DFF3EE|nr:DUF1491 family protein [Paracoccus sp. (in: a-proteobacteria)]MDO5371118.1 DUF1491 family protein [Paracoccus sp. (in: a-proteobacteria)]